MKGLSFCLNRSNSKVTLIHVTAILVYLITLSLKIFALVGKFKIVALVAYYQLAVTYVQCFKGW